MGITRAYRIGLGMLGLVLAGQTPATAQDLRLVNAVAAQDHEAVRALFDEGVDVNAARADGATALLWAAHWNDREAISRLVARGADVNAADDHGVTPLERAAENASPEVVEALLAAGARATVMQTNGLTPLMTAARTGHVRVVDALLTHGADVNHATDETDSTALMWAVAGRHQGVARVLLDAGADPTASTINGFTPMLFAASNGDVEMATILMSAGVRIDKAPSEAIQALPYAIVTGHDEFALFLLEHGADPNGTMAGVAALHAAAGRVGTWLRDWNRTHAGGAALGTFGRRSIDPIGGLKLTKALLARGADPDVRIRTSAMFMSYIGYPRRGAFEPFACGTGDLRGATPLWVAAFWANAGVQDIRDGRGDNRGLMNPARTRAGTEIIRVLLEAGADLRLTTDDGTTPLMVAAGLGRSTYTPREPRGMPSPGAEAAVKVLVESGADINAVNEADFTALHGAALRGLNEVVEYLVEQGADIDARDFRGRTAYRMAEGTKQSFQFQSWPDTAKRLEKLGADPRLGIPGTVQERLRDLRGESADAEPLKPR
ncbi:MAG: ankyrin repeat domain-containing protein [Acidobacteriota bacterium]|nr:ankyrin repeat domain-containing protein [Acidobacteriota bacterium]